MSVKEDTQDRVGAVKTAGERLESIELWTRATFIAAVVAASFLGMITLMLGLLGFEYVRLKMAAQEAASSFQKDMQERFKAAVPPAKGKTSGPRGPF